MTIPRTRLNQTLKKTHTPTRNDLLSFLIWSVLSEGRSLWQVMVISLVAYPLSPPSTLLPRSSFLLPTPYSPTPYSCLKQWVQTTSYTLPLLGHMCPMIHSTLYTLPSTPLPLHYDTLWYLSLCIKVINRAWSERCSRNFSVPYSRTEEFAVTIQR